jgi:hypothetical protein
MSVHLAAACSATAVLLFLYHGFLASPFTAETPSLLCDPGADLKAIKSQNLYGQNGHKNAC